MKIQCIVNTQAVGGRMEAVTASLAAAFFGHDCRIDGTAYAGHATEMAADAVASGYDMLVAVGGDGTVHEVVNGARRADIHIGLVPCGSANDLAARLDIPSDIHSACRIILEGRAKRIDAAMVDGRYVLTTCGIGFPAAVIAATKGMCGWGALGNMVRRRLKYRLYLLGLAAAISGHMPRYVVRLDGEGVYRRCSAVSVIVGLQSGLGRFFTVLPEPSADDPGLQCRMINAGSRVNLMRHVALALGKKAADRYDGDVSTASGFLLEVDRTAAVFGDGEIIGTGRYFKIQLVRQAVAVMVPPGEGRRP